MKQSIREGIRDCVECKDKGPNYTAHQYGDITFSLCPKCEKQFRFWTRKIEVQRRKQSEGS